MYTVVLHRLKDPATAFSRGERLMTGDGAPPGARVLQFYPSQDRTTVTCLWESDSVDALQEYVDTTLGDSSENECYPVDADQAFAERPLGLPESATVGA